MYLHCLRKQPPLYCSCCLDLAHLQHCDRLDLSQMQILDCDESVDVNACAGDINAAVKVSSSSLCLSTHAQKQGQTEMTHLPHSML